MFCFVQSHSASVISPIFTMNRENPTGMEQYMNGMEKIKPEQNDKGQNFNLAHALRSFWRLLNKL